MSAVILEEALQELFYDLHDSGLFADGKEISDAVLSDSPDVILNNYREEREAEGFDLMSFFGKYFKSAPELESGYKSDTSIATVDHINNLWEVLSRSPNNEVQISTKIPLPYPYIVPGGRFNEIYYWDSYFTMLGLKVSGKVDMIKYMVDNFAHMLKTYGLIPNGNRTYYLGRSQPPFFACMVQLLASISGDDIYLTYRDALRTEYDFWMTHDGSQQPFKRVVPMGNGMLNRYFDNIEQPRTEMYTDDMEVIAAGGQELVTHIRAACESGWDFSARWFKDVENLDTIHTTDIIPVDLNCLLYNLELVLCKAYRLSNENEKAEEYQRAAEQTKKLMLQYFWNDEEGCFYDFDNSTKSPTGVLSLAAVFPMYFKIASKEQAEKVAEMISQKLLKAGGFVSTDITSGQQWDSPNGWAPLQWMAYIGLKNYGYTELANEAKGKWLSLNEKIYQATGKMMEKYNVVDTTLESGGGEYPVQDGFGWTNGVYLALKNN